MRHGRMKIGSGLAIAFALVACSDDPSVTTTPTSRTDGGAGPDGGGPDAASIKPRPELCEGVKRGGDVVSEKELPGDAPPPIGGPIDPGTYDLLEMNAYRGAEPLDAGGEEPPSTRLTGRAAQATIVVGPFEMSFVEARGTSQPDGLGPEQTRAVLYRTEGTSLIETAVCPTTALPASRSFSGITGSIVLFPDAKHRELYKRRP